MERCYRKLDTRIKRTTFALGYDSILLMAALPQRGFQDAVGPRPIYVDVDGAPFKIGERVRVTDSKDETFDYSLKGQIGVVEYFEYECGCGQHYPDDPMIGVRFQKDRIEEFWAEELARQLARSRRHRSSHPLGEPE
jgi:hypothetical protein